MIMNVKWYRVDWVEISPETLWKNRKRWSSTYW